MPLGSTSFGVNMHINQHLLLMALVQETDRIYFTPWLALTPEDPNWLYSSLKKVCDALST